MSNTMLFLLTVLLTPRVTQVTFQQSVTKFSVPRSNFGWSMIDVYLDYFYQFVLSDCARECWYSKQCKSFHYNKVGKTCSLNRIHSSQASSYYWVYDKKYVFSDKEQWPRYLVTMATRKITPPNKCSFLHPTDASGEVWWNCAMWFKRRSSFMLTDDGHRTAEDRHLTFGDHRGHLEPLAQALAGSCADEPCGSREKCMPSRPPRCVGHCGSPYYFPNGFFWRGCTIAGCKLEHACFDGYVSTLPRAKILCQENGRWTSYNFECIAHCGPPPSVSNAVVGPGLEIQDANRTYTCQEPYTASTPSMTILCQANSIWTAPDFQCN